MKSGANCLMPVYKRQPVTFVKGRGSTLWDKAGKTYLDFFSGLAVCNLGHAHPAVTRAVARQMKTLLHTSNLYHTEPQRELAGELCRRAFGGRVFLSNSGAEANECAIKLARRWGLNTPVGGRPRSEIIVFDQSFHGRTLGTLSATAQKKFQTGFGKLLEGFPAAAFGDIAAVQRLINRRTCAVLIEPIQGEGGVRMASGSFFKELAALCRRHRLLLIFDEIQTGMGRTGALFAYQNPSVVPPGVVPDVLSCAKALANGLPIGATLARGPAANLFGFGDHGSTFGGGAVVCQAALAVLKEMSPQRLNRVKKLGTLFEKEMSAWVGAVPAVKAVRGAGCMWGIELDRPGADAVAYCRERGLLVNCTQDTVVRLLPPFCLTNAEVSRGLKTLKKALLDLGKTPPGAH